MHSTSIEKLDKKGKAYYEKEGQVLAEMTFSVVNPRFIIIDHTEVDDSLRGEGVGKQLLQKIVDHARQNEIKIMPLCPFAKHVFEEDESLQDVLK